MCSRLFPTFSSICFSVSGFMLRSLIHLDLSFVKGDKNELICILPHAKCQLNQHHCWKCCLFFFFPTGWFSSFDKDQVTIGVWVHFWVFHSVPVIFLPVSVTIPCRFYHYSSVVQLEVRDGDSTRCSFIVENTLHYHGVSVIPNEFVNCSFYLYEELPWNFD